MNKSIIKYFLLLIVLISGNLAHAQDTLQGRAIIRKAFKDGDLQLALTELNKQTNYFFQEENMDTLTYYVEYVGNIHFSLSGAEKSIKEVENFVSEIHRKTTNPSTLSRLYQNAAGFYEMIEKYHHAYSAAKEALKFTDRIPGRSDNQLAAIENDMGVYADRMGNASLSEYHNRRALATFQSAKDTNYERLYLAYVSMGGIMWYASKYDSASFYYKEALNALAKLDKNDPLNHYYRPALLNNNLAGIYGIEGKTTESIQAMKTTINHLKSFLAIPGPHTKKNDALAFQFQAIENLGGIYKELGDLRQAKQLLEYSYEQKLKVFDSTNQEIFKSLVLLGQLYYAQREYQKAEQFLTKGLQKFQEQAGGNLFWEADACYSLALIYDHLKNIPLATRYYEEGDKLYEQAFQGFYDNSYLDFLRNAAQFYAENNHSAKAILLAKKGYDYGVKTQGNQSLTSFYQLLNLSEVYLKSDQFNKALEFSIKGLDVVNYKISQSNNLLDSIKISLNKPKAILLKAKAEYNLLPAKDSTSLISLLKDLDEALSILETRKSVITDAGDIRMLMADHTDLLAFVKQLSLDLYEETKNQAYLDKMISLHESGMYNRIRSRLEANDSLRFSHVPISVQEKEKRLSRAIAEAFEGTDSYEEKIRKYFAAVEERNQLQEEIRKNYPRYYDLRYSSIFKSLSDIQQLIPEKGTLIRYLFVNNELLALVADKNTRQLFRLNDSGLEDDLRILSSEWMNVEKTSAALHDLYNKLWGPLQAAIKTNKVVIVPDGILFNLSFEMLTPKRIQHFREMASGSLLTDYIISYHYSLFLLDPLYQSRKAEKNFVGFAPGFLDQQKKKYASVEKDSLAIDKNYLSLLPLPFTVDLAKYTKSLFGGKIFINEESTKNIFKENAGYHKIIHIGTHAESNNTHPEYSRLIFSPNLNQNADDHSLFLFEIYNCELNSNLTVLTACESGKPSFQDGEGMISLAHAFNYAGSESILTSLWKIDEQSSAIITKYFYHNLRKGMAKDEALRQAKLGYLSESKGRMLAPQYWAGLVILGDAGPVELPEKNTNIFYLIGVTVLVAGLTMIIRNRRKTVKQKIRQLPRQ
ncbi:MAG TPA: CHAT domain-containing tetratricopeptide repeat protein [Parasegetibacter sp.]